MSKVQNVGQTAAFAPDSFAAMFEESLQRSDMRAGRRCTGRGGEGEGEGERREWAINLCSPSLGRRRVLPARARSNACCMHASVCEPREGIGDCGVRLALLRCGAPALAVVQSAAVTAGAGHASSVLLQVEISRSL